MSAGTIKPAQSAFLLINVINFSVFSYIIVIKYTKKRYEGMRKMEMNMKKISVCDYNKHSRTKATVDADVIVPDKNEDIHRILSVTAVADVSEKYVRTDKMIFSGNVKFNILYVGEDSRTGITSIEYTAPFNHQCDMTDADEDTLMFTSCTICNTKYEVKNSRKISVEAALRLDTTGYRACEAQVPDISELSNDLPAKTLEYENDAMVICKEFEFTQSDTVVIPASDSVCKIYSVSVRPDITEIKTVNNKAVVKGSADLQILYSSGGELSCCDSEVTFTEIVDVDSISPDHTVSHRFELADYNAEVNTGETDTSFEVSFKIRGAICAYEHFKETLVGDIYSPDYQYEVGLTQYSTNCIDAVLKHQTTVKDNVNISEIDSSVSKILSVNSYVVCNSSKLCANSVKIEGNLESNIIYIDDALRPASVRRSAPFEIDVPCDEMSGNPELSADVVCTKCGYVLNSSGEVQIRAIVKAEVTAFSADKLSLITDFKIDKDNPVEKSSQPSIVVCYPESECDLWEIAKKYNTTVDEIKKVNSLDESAVCIKSKPVIIPKRQIS